MTLDGGWGYILSTVIGVMLSEMLSFARRHSEHREGVSNQAARRAQETADQALSKAMEAENELLKYRIEAQKDFAPNRRVDGLEERIFQMLESIDEKLDRKADKEH
ncbi:hypothetical protein [Paraburkholderia kururiensis]|uniref:hypothetical protein n=1 Tax=Paraburkholderia kururiensis TaxID=984307 RepID=UPI0003486B6D|nr:hypothetical protein [Paraburkholderia kururiensis]